MSNKDVIKNKEELILEAGSKIFSKRSFHEVKMQEIADMAGVGKGTIYEYFSSKDDLLEQIIKMGINQYREKISIKKIKGKDLWEKLEKFLMANVDFFWDNKEIGILIIQSDHSFQKSLRDWLLVLREDSIKDLEQVFNDAVKNGEIKDTSPLLVAKFFRSIISEVIPATIILENKRPKKDDISEVIDILKDGLQGKHL